MYRHIFELLILIFFSTAAYLIYLQVKPLISGWLKARREAKASMRAAIDKAREAHKIIEERREVNEQIKHQIEDEIQEAEQFIGKKS